jgi:hypothetical protein
MGNDLNKKNNNIHIDVEIVDNINYIDNNNELKLSDVEE